MVVSSCKFLSNFVFKFRPIVIRMGDTMFCATWDDTGNVGVVNLMKAKLEEFTTSTGSDRGKHITLMLNKLCFSSVSYISGVRREILMETDDLVFKLRLTFDIRCMASEKERLPQIEEDPSLLYHKSMCQIST